MLIVFEGIDGSGKTTLSNRVARVLAERGLKVRHVREGGRLASATAEAIRQVARDQKNLSLSPTAEMLLYAARDAQQLDEAIRPALGDYDVVIADRYLHTAWVMAVAGRGLPADDADRVIRAAGRGLEPAFTVLIDVDPHLARIRRRVHKLIEPDARPPSRKGLSGEGLMHRLRDGYRELATRHPESWLVVDNSDADLELIVDDLHAAVLSARASGLAAARGLLKARARARGLVTGPARVMPQMRDASAARAAFLAWIDRRSPREPAVAAWMLGGLVGDDVDRRRQALAATVPRFIARGLTAMVDESAWALREQLADVAPLEVAGTLKWAAADDPRAWRLRERLQAVAPWEVATSLTRLASARVTALRLTLYPIVPLAVVSSLAGDGSDAAWTLRDRLLAECGPVGLADPFVARALAASVSALDGPRAWDVRKQVRMAAPAAVLASLVSLTSEQAWRWRERWIERAPRPVLKSVAGLAEPRAWALRQRGLGLSGKDALDSIWGLDGESAWALREAAAPTWPASVVRSLGPLAGTAPGAALVARLLAEHPGHLMLWKHAGAQALPASQTEIAAAR
jgi:dTMP kinase